MRGVCYGGDREGKSGQHKRKHKNHELCKALECEDQVMHEMQDTVVMCLPGMQHQPVRSSHIIGNA